MSMNCKHYEQDLLLLAHGQLEAGSQKQVRQHLHDCPACGERLAYLSGVSLLLADAIQTASPPPTLKMGPRPSFFPGRESWLMSVLLAAFVTIALLSAWKSAKSFVPAVAPPTPPPTSTGQKDCLVSPSSPRGVMAGNNCPLHRRSLTPPIPSPTKQ